MKTFRKKIIPEYHYQGHPVHLSYSSFKFAVVSENTLHLPQNIFFPVSSNTYAFGKKEPFIFSQNLLSQFSERMVLYDTKKFSTSDIFWNMSVKILQCTFTMHVSNTTLTCKYVTFTAQTTTADDDMY